MPEWISNLTVIGLAYDMVGVVLVAVGVFWKSARNIANEAGTFWSSNPYQLLSIAKSQVDTIAGLILLVMVFFLQILGTLRVSPPDISIWCLWGLWLAVLLAYVTGLRLFIVGIRMRQVDNYMRDSKIQNEK